MIKRPVIYYPCVIAGILALIVVFVKALLPCLILDFFPGSYQRETYHGRIRIEYWEKWTGFEGEAMQALVDQFNSSQDRIFVEKQTISRIDQRFLVSVAGKNPPDVAGLQAFMIPNFAAKGALLPLDDLARIHGIKKEDYIPIFWNLGCYNDKLYALPTTPVTLALHYNKRLFREAGLDPEKPPQTLEELDEMAQKLTQYDQDGEIKVIGFSPSHPGWYHWAWGFWFGGRLWDGMDRLTINDPGNIEAFLWIQNYPRRYGVEKLQTFQSGFGNFASAQNPFLTEQVAMELQGVWMYNFIDKYNPSLEWGAAPFPSPMGEKYNCSLADCDDLVIPRDARHPKEAFEFIRFVQEQENMEFLCMGQRKFSPLKKVSAEFWENHPHPYIRLFYNLAKSHNISAQPMIPVFQEIRDELNAAFSRVWLLEQTPEQALKAVQKRIDRAWKDEKLRMQKRSKTI
ncbi:ABC transporter substrate-binding protein [Candidatus Sumerlaeota bacterium]|nr:ABC transporter substrate-binding protein [Candidatus Sumerlaeota bacterium]